MGLIHWLRLPEQDGMPDDWAIRVQATTLRYGDHILRYGRGPGSLEPEAEAGLDYTVLTASGVRAYLPFLWRLYAGPYLRPAVEAVVGEPLVVAPSEAAINVNVVQGQGGRYEKHTDSSPYVALLYATDTRPEIGGGLAVWPPHDPDVGPEICYPQAGDILVFDGEASAHAVLPLIGATIRTSIPMLYPPLTRQGLRDAELDHYLYGA